MRQYDSRREIGGRAQRIRLRPRGDVAQLLDGLLRVDRRTELDLRAAQELEASGALGPVLQRKLSQVTLAQLGSALEIAAIERHECPAQRCGRVPAGLLEKRLSFVELALTPSQLAQP